MVQETDERVPLGVDSEYLIALQSFTLPHPLSVIRVNENSPNDSLDPSTYRVAPCPDPKIDDYFRFVAKSGRAVFEWKTVRNAFLWKLEAVIREMCTLSPSSPPTSLPCAEEDGCTSPLTKNVNVEKRVMPAQQYIERLIQQATHLDGIPFTFQRLCELLTEPRRHYKRADKYLRALEKNINVVTTVLPDGERDTRRAKQLDDSLDDQDWSPGHETPEQLTNGVDSNVSEATTEPLDRTALSADDLGTPTRDEREQQAFQSPSSATIDVTSVDSDSMDVCQSSSDVVERSHSGPSVPQSEPPSVPQRSLSEPSTIVAQLSTADTEASTVNQNMTLPASVGAGDACQPDALQQSSSSLPEQTEPERMDTTENSTESPAEENHSQTEGEGGVVACADDAPTPEGVDLPAAKRAKVEGE